MTVLQCFMHAVAAGWLSHVPITAAIGTIAFAVLGIFCGQSAHCHHSSTV